MLYREILKLSIRLSFLIGAEKIYTSPPADVDAFAAEAESGVSCLLWGGQPRDHGSRQAFSRSD